MSSLANTLDIGLGAVETKIKVSQIKDVKRIYVARQSDTLQSISVKFFGDFTSWEDIKKANNLQTNVLEEGQALVIPS